MAKHTDEINVFENVLTRIGSLDSSYGRVESMQVTMDLFATRDPRSTDSGGVFSAGAYQVQTGSRPDIGELVRGAVGSNAASTAVLACGPTSMVDACRGVAHDTGCEFHSECFFL